MFNIIFSYKYNTLSVKLHFIDKCALPDFFHGFLVLFYWNTRNIGSKLYPDTAVHWNSGIFLEYNDSGQ